MWYLLDAQKWVLKCPQEVVFISLLHYILKVFLLSPPYLISWALFLDISKVNFRLFMLILFDFLFLLQYIHSLLMNSFKPFQKYLLALLPSDVLTDIHKWVLFLYDVAEFENSFIIFSGLALIY